MFFCKVKIAYFSTMIIYHVVDLALGWVNFGYKVCYLGIFSGVPTTSPGYKPLFAVSCVIGMFCGLALCRVYCYYIGFHCDCMQRGRNRGRNSTARYQKVRDQEENTNFIFKCSNDNERAKLSCDRRFVVAELTISTVELFFKETIRIGLLVYVMGFHSGIQLGWVDILFVSCSIFAHLKLMICYVVNMYRVANDQKIGCESWHCCLLFFACVGCLIFVGLSIAFLVLGLA